MNLGSIKPVFAALALAAAGGAFAQKTQLTVYTALETDQLKAYESGFTKDNPGIDIKWVRDGYPPLKSSAPPALAPFESKLVAAAAGNRRSSR